MASALEGLDINNFGRLPVAGSMQPVQPIDYSPLHQIQLKGAELETQRKALESKLKETARQAEGSALSFSMPSEGNPFVVETLY